MQRTNMPIGYKLPAPPIDSFHRARIFRRPSSVRRVVTAAKSPASARRRVRLFVVE